VILSEAPSDPKSAETVIIRRAELEATETVDDAVWTLANASATAAHWSRATLYPYIGTESARGALQAKSLFLAWVNPAVHATATTGPDNASNAIDGIVGFAAFSAILTIGVGESTLENMAVAAPWQRQGIGGRLLRAGLLWCRSQAAGRVFLEVRATNATAIALYQRAGFLAVGNRPGYYREPSEDGLQMQKVLDPVASAG
jgi:ribosomal protein S18 acetylase RimI-like enzyme